MVLTKEEKKALREKLTMANKKGEDLWRKPGEIDGKAFAINNLEDCNVFVLDHTSQILIDKCKNTKFFLGPIKNSVFFRDCDNCQIHVPCNQFRCRDLNNSIVYLFCETDPIIESSVGLTFAPYNLAYPFLDSQVEACGMKTEENKWDFIFDFTDTNESGEKVKHFQLLDPSDFQIVYQSVEGVENQPALVFPIPQKYGGSATDNDTSKKQDDGVTFDIRTTSAADAQKIFDEQQRRIDAAAAKSNPEPVIQARVHNYQLRNCCLCI